MRDEARILQWRAPVMDGVKGEGFGYDGPERRQELPELHLPSWMVAILITTLFAMLSVVFSMGMTYMRVQSDADRIEKIERDLRDMEQRFNRIDQQLQSNVDHLEKHDEEIRRLEQRPRPDKN